MSDEQNKHPYEHLENKQINETISFVEGEIESLDEKLKDAQEHSKKSKRDSIIAVGAAAILALTGGICAENAHRIGYNPERNLFISTGTYAEHYQGENPKQVLDTLNHTLRSYAKDASFNGGTLNGIEEANNRNNKSEKDFSLLSSMLNQVSKLEDSLWYSHLYKTIEDSTWGNRVTDNPKQYPEANALLNHSGESLYEKALELRGLMQESGEIPYDFVAPLSSIISKAKHLDEKIWEGFPSSAASKEDVQRTRSEVNYFGEQLRELGESIPTNENYNFVKIISIIGALACVGSGIQSFYKCSGTEIYIDEKRKKREENVGILRELRYQRRSNDLKEKIKFGNEQTKLDNSE